MLNPNQLPLYSSSLSSPQNYHYLNGLAGMEYARDFFQPPDSVSTCTCNSDSTHYTSFDPRLIDAPRAIRTILDRPALQTQGTQPLTNMFDQCGPTAGTFYPNYSKVDGGQILYYTDLDNDTPYDSNVFVIDSKIQPYIFQDPMGALRPYYDKIPLLKNDRNHAQYTFDRDQMAFREDIMALQSRQQLYSQYGAYHMYFQNPSQSYPLLQKKENH